LRKKTTSGKKKKVKATIGWREWVALPDLNVKAIKAKVDTGARSSSLHVFDLKVIEREGVQLARFKVYPAQRSKRDEIQAEATILEFRSVKSSSGKSSIRPVIVTTISLLDQTWQAEVTLANRDEMGFRMLLGREAFRNRFLVDAGNSYFGGRPKRKKKLTTLQQKELS
jgi:hypothetical protein